jgi:Pyridine nucleotide-disulphide oxidoreductase, dimerisation domain
VTLVAERAGDLLHEFVLAMKADIGLATVAATVHAYPTLAEIAKKVADRQQKSRLTPFARRVLAWRYRRARGGA